MTATGIPTSVFVAQELAELRAEVRQVSSDREKDRDKIIEAVYGLPVELASRLLNTFSVEEAQVTRRDLDDRSLLQSGRLCRLASWAVNNIARPEVLALLGSVEAYVVPSCLTQLPTHLHGYGYDGIIF